MSISNILLSPYGRIGRITFLVATIFQLAFNAMLSWLLGFHVGGAAPSALASLLLLALTWPTIAITVKRFHDLDMSGWWTLLPAVAFFSSISSTATLFLVGTSSQGLLVVLAMGFVSLVVALGCLWQLIKLFFFAGSGATNRFGPPPHLAKILFGAESGAIPQPTTTARARDDAPAAEAVQVVTRVAKPARSSGPSRPAGFGRRTR